ncbi:PEP-CTERM domain protein [Sphingomonas sp. KC8]|nr:PEPxxWA-CTERM sorting domain-containing protein [Sphingomonas sp. KC8]ARS27076.1 PEP-CTERM domain protein [Sphingomonas sp. KC8]
MRKTLIYFGAVASALLCGASPALAATTLCAKSDLSAMVLACSGFYSKNVLNNNASSIDTQQQALAALGFDWDGDFSKIEKIDNLGGLKTVDFSTLLTGVTYVGFHFGNGKGGPGNATAFYKLDAGVEGLDTIKLFYEASSNAVLYYTSKPPVAVPEPATWAMMIAGFGLVGAAMRRRRNWANVLYV